jgi:hypothetical protein
MTEPEKLPAGPHLVDTDSADRIRKSQPAAIEKRDTPKRPDHCAFKPGNCSPLTWWRRLPPDAIGGVERSRLLATLDNIGVLHGGDDVAAAIRGDATAAIHAASVLMPIAEITLQVDVKLTALMRTALDGDAASALVMAQIIGLSEIGCRGATELAVSWLDRGEFLSSEPDKFREARAILLTAFKDRAKAGDDA